MTFIHSWRAYEMCVSCKPDSIFRLLFIIPVSESHRDEESCPSCKNVIKSLSEFFQKSRLALWHKGFRVFWPHSHSIEAGGFVVTSSTTRLAWGTSLTMRAETVAIRS